MAKNNTVPIVLAYGVRWSRKLWQDVQKSELPRFKNFKTTGIYVYYWKGHATYIGIATQPIDRRILQHHHTIGEKWDSFSWFVVNNQLFVRDIENLVLRAFTSRGPGQTKGRKPGQDAVLKLNSGASGFLNEHKSYMGYWLDSKGRLTVTDRSAIDLLHPSWHARCRIKGRKD